MRVGYARVSTIDQNPELQLEALRRAGCEKVFTERGSGARDDRPESSRILSDVLRTGDTLVVWKLDRLARSLKKLIATAEELERAKMIRERTTAGLVEARQRGRKGGRPPAMRPNDIAAARALMKEGSIPVRSIAERMGVSVATLYRHIGKKGGAPKVAETGEAHG
ncbi:recombinase family protein [Ensifer sp. SL37]|uniref:recombinase family protein n=1 Tax=Ensifer sp. SL37 TaxID=2995137 RepID=UPI0022756C1A|nr:recombinase family protein [Ensifer sp. SL37]MCY1740853.1 recombinase family protein [Ensifer sp. SL37]